MCELVIRVINWLKLQPNGTPVDMKAFNTVIFEETNMEKQKGGLSRWVMNADSLWSEEDQRIRRRIRIREYLKDLAELK